LPDSRISHPVILVVEDNVDDEALSTRALRQQLPHARIAVARDGHDAVECTAGTLTINDVKVETTPSLILLDLKLPKIHGLDVLMAVRDCPTTKYVPVVVFSSSDERQDVDRAYARGANTYVRKPTEYEDYMRAVRMIADYWFNFATLPVTA